MELIMQAKTIKKVLRRKINDWLNTIEDENLRNEVRNNCIVTGGCIASMLLGEKVNDYDVYFTNKDIVLKITNYYVEKFKNISKMKFKNSNKAVDIYVKDIANRVKIIVKSAGIASSESSNNYEYFEMNSQDDPNFELFVDDAVKILNNDDNNHKKYEPIFLTSNAITLSNDIQLVIRFYGIPEEIHKNYDFVHCTNYWESKTNKLTLHKEALESLLSKNLIYIGSKYPLASIIRTRKFINRGFHCNAGQYLKMCWQVSQLCLDDLSVLEEQLTGVDAAYFHALIEGLKAEQEKRKDFKYNYSYICEIIDRIF